MSYNTYNLIVVAHPDDESIYFAGLIQSKKEIPWKIICITNGNADGHEQLRRQQFTKACHSLKVADFEHWDFPDVFDKRLPILKVKERLSQLPLPKKVYTHGIIGEYGHPHHQDVSYAVHQTFAPKTDVFSVNYNCFPEEVINLTETQFNIKTQILTGIYGSEINRFAHIVPGTPVEGFCRVSWPEVDNIYQFLAHQAPLQEKYLIKYKWLQSHLEETLGAGLPRLF